MMDAARSVASGHVSGILDPAENVECDADGVSQDCDWQRIRPWQRMCPSQYLRLREMRGAAEYGWCMWVARIVELEAGAWVCGDAAWFQIPVRSRGYRTAFRLPVTGTKYGQFRK